MTLLPVHLFISLKFCLNRRWWSCWMFQWKRTVRIMNCFSDVVFRESSNWLTLICVLTVFDQNGRTLPANYAQQTMNKSSPLAHLLPSMRGYGVCSIALICFLCKKQNDFLEQYLQIKQQKCVSYIVSNSIVHSLNYSFRLVTLDEWACAAISELK